MTAPFYVSPEQLMKDRAEFARKGIARGRSVIVCRYDSGIALVAHNPSSTLHKVAEIYDRIAFAAVGKYNEFETLRQAGVRYADLRGFSYDRADVTARGLTNAYAQTLASVFTTESKPFEVELVVAELGETPTQDRLYRLSYDGSVADESDCVVIGGNAEVTAQRMHLTPGLKDLDSTINTAVRALFGDEDPVAAHVEAAVLDRNTQTRRTFVRLTEDQVRQALERAGQDSKQTDETPGEETGE
ncbi:proteasome subunit alpha [Brevibacterium sp. UMB1308A]|uniref:proteasome subunit alpha n=1 Tax=Brevibacterium sp. UMB1308A TaxID=3050608 RepID=UPI00254BB66A|nr:proteasome subunit alpha [Brevibacterium sp. UMB1308A]MDK8345368.1 proteasome subunit alpha [Brevibacterium sp. UMB1308B]MDK8713767.1 proteasome subunit alpha [Brevibacterium sp. UMB1308A]